jgi:hypothetical protein
MLGFSLLVHWVGSIGLQVSPRRWRSNAPARSHYRTSGTALPAAGVDIENRPAHLLVTVVGDYCVDVLRKL